MKAKFTSTEEAGLVILYGNTDIWAQMSEAEKAGLTRDDIDNSFVSAADIRDIFAMNGEVATAVYGGKEYYIVDTSASAEISGVSITAPMTVAIKMANGYMYQFHFMGGRTDPHYADFEALLCNVKFPAPEGDGENALTEPKAQTGTVIRLVFGLLIAVVICVASVAIYKRATRKEPAGKKNATHAGTAPEETPAIPEHLFCRMCGAQVPVESEFCHKCGAKVYRGEE